MCLEQGLAWSKSNRNVCHHYELLVPISVYVGRAHPPWSHQCGMFTWLSPTPAWRAGICLYFSVISSAHGAQSNPPQVQWGASPRGSWDPVQSLTPGQEYSMLGEMLPRVGQALFLLLGGRGVPTLSLGRKMEQSCGRTSQQDARRLGLSHYLPSEGEGGRSHTKAEPWSG